jgi:hypothetical protein
MRSQPLSSAAGRRRAEEQFKTKKKVDSAETPHSKPRWREPRACARFGWPKKQPTGRLQVATQRQRRRLDLRRADTFRADLGLRVRQNPIKDLVAPSSRRPSPAYQRASFCLTPSLRFSRTCAADCEYPAVT